MLLSALLEGVTVTKLFQTLYGKMVVTHDVEIGSLTADSRKVAAAAMFVAVRGTGVDGHDYLQDAVASGAKALVVERENAIDDHFCMHAGVVKIVVPDTRSALGTLASNWFGRPSEKMTVVGITGTNGKTTVSWILHDMLTGAGRPAGLIGTVEYRIGAATRASTHTTPGPVELNGLLGEMEQAGCRSAVMEVSSHALDQKRTDGVRFHSAVFTNLTADHLDYHPTPAAYFAAKKRLFAGLDDDAWAVINVGNDAGEELAKISRGRIFTYLVEIPGRPSTLPRGEAARLTARIRSVTLAGTGFTVGFDGGTTDMTTPLVGAFNVENILAALGAGITLGMSMEEMKPAIGAFRGVPGRFDPVRSPEGWTAIIDYAHTPDALQQTLDAVRALMPKGSGRIITVFGCGGNRDRTKRPLMGKIAAAGSDITIVTSDNPRNEDPERIIDDVLAGADSPATILRESDRGAAIAKALERARKGDVILIAGKGHEEYQIAGGKRTPFSDRAAVEKIIHAG